MSSDRKNFSLRFRNLRELHNWSQEELGSFLGVTGAYVGMVERGVKELDAGGTLAKLFAVLEKGNGGRVMGAAPVAGVRVEEADGGPGRSPEAVLDDMAECVRLMRESDEHSISLRLMLARNLSELAEQLIRALEESRSYVRGR